MPIFKAPQDISKKDISKPSIFLAGSIDMDKAVNWQKYCEDRLDNAFNVFNPRRESWNSDWKQEIENEKFREQVEWELNALEEADDIILFFAANTKSPISLLEFGLFAKSRKLKVVCENGFWRKGNVDVVCEMYGVERYDNLNAVINKLKK